LANKTRRRLTKTELKKDPIAENLMKGMDFLQSHLKELIGLGIIIVVGIIVVQMVVGSSRKAENEAMAGYITADILFAQAEQYSAANQPETSVQALQACYTLATEVYSQNSNRSWGRRAAILSAKAGIILGLDEQVITTLQDLLSTGPDPEIANGARIHLAIALENRGGIEDLRNAALHLQEVVDQAPAESMIAAEAMAGLARIAYRREEYEEAADWLARSLAITGDTTDFASYQLARLEFGHY
jgi:tetratricopeptide (TPR) repeat protein